MMSRKLAAARPRIVTLCGSTRFSEAFHKANFDETLAGRIVLTIGCDMRNDSELFGDMPPDIRAKVKANLDLLHLEKISISDEILVLNVGGYIGESTAREIAFAVARGIPVRYLEPLGDSNDQ